MSLGTGALRRNRTADVIFVGLSLELALNDRSHALRGNAARDAPRSASECDAERHGMHSHAERGDDHSMCSVGAAEGCDLLIFRPATISATSYKNHTAVRLRRKAPVSKLT